MSLQCTDSVKEETSECTEKYETFIFMTRTSKRGVRLLCSTLGQKVSMHDETPNCASCAHNSKQSWLEGGTPGLEGDLNAHQSLRFQEAHHKFLAELFVLLDQVQQ